MNCAEYVERFLSAHADNQLSLPERHLAEEHLRSCYQCRRWLAEERDLKQSIRRHAGTIKAPADVRLRIRAALGEAADRPGNGLRRPRFSRRDDVQRGISSNLRPALAPGSSHSRDQTPQSTRWTALQLKRAHYFVPAGLLAAALAATTLVVRLTFTPLAGSDSTNLQRSVPAFDFAIGRLNRLSADFSPNVPPEAFSRDSDAYFAWVEGNDPLRHVSAELPDISVSYEKIAMLPEFCDFDLAGYELVGGRVERMPNGEPVTYTLYRSQDDSILSIGLKQRISPPQGGYWLGTHALYSYRDYSICLTSYPVGDFSSIIVARIPMVEMLRNIATSDITGWDR
jgi:hypothetical protein